MISHGMRITFDPDFDSGSWPGPLHNPHDSGSARTAVAREPWVGPMGLLFTMTLGFLFTISRATILSPGTQKFTHAHRNFNYRHAGEMLEVHHGKPFSLDRSQQVASR